MNELVILGAATRIAVIPTIGVTAIGYFVVHRKDNWAGRISIDSFIFYKLFK